MENKAIHLLICSHKFLYLNTLEISARGQTPAGILYTEFALNLESSVHALQETAIHVIPGNFPES